MSTLVLEQLEQLLRRWAMSNRSRTDCLASSLSGRCAAIVSARRPGSSMPAMRRQDLRRDLLVQLDVLVELLRDGAAQRLDFGRRVGLRRDGHDSATKCSPLSLILASTRAGCLRPAPSRCRRAASASAGCSRRNRSRTCRRRVGSSLPAAFWATSMIWRPASIAASKALMDLGRPTNSGITMCGNTTTSRSGSSGSVIGSAAGWDVRT
jgi:hypothetical protein